MSESEEPELHIPNVHPSDPYWDTLMDGYKTEEEEDMAQHIKESRFSGGWWLVLIFIIFLLLVKCAA